ncbi:aspartate aminotransferase [Kiloniella litopenaei]|uniref:Aminotransferase n=1 Tax=Kiloniella litopenaei TaxID=1549748 RepID=A0A0M2R8R8_9PROT|nr:pyridoxal phosphate-dependent aminotransferase [Kiloniella litopenaei]KKJ76849.1 aspartate aminotransferase [Kiloniella litopenaei]
MQLSPLTKRVTGAGASAWDLHSKALQEKSEGKDVIVMSVGDPDFSTPEKITAAAKDALDAGDTHYTELTGRYELRDILAKRHSRLTKQPVTADNVIVLAGAQCALFTSSLCIATQGDEIIALEPMYITYEASICVTGATIVPVSQLAETGFRPDIKAIEDAITPKTKAIFLTTPNNPTGVVMTQTELEKIAQLAQAHNLWVIADEVYSDLIFAGEHVSIGSLPGMAERTVTISSLSKSHAMTGWRLGWAIGPRHLIQAMEKIALCMLYGLPGFSQEAAKVALTDLANEPKRMKEIYHKRRDLTLKSLKPATTLLPHCPQAGMFLLVDIRSTGLTSREFAENLYSQTGVCVLDAEPFGHSAKGHIRLSFTLSEEQIVEGCRRICEFCDSLSQQKTFA